MLELDPDAEWSQEGPSLSNDIWKKFELILTPPRSPLRETDMDVTSSFPGKDIFNFKSESMDFHLDFGNTLELPLLEEDDLNLDLESIDLDAELPYDLTGSGPGGLPCAHGLGRGTCTSCTQLALAGSELRHDCMWVGTCTAEAHNHGHRHPRTHKDSGSQITDLLLDCSSAALESAAGFTHIADLHCVDDPADTHMHVEEASLHQPFSGKHVARPETPSESSETDTDEDIDHYDDDDYELERVKEQYGVCHEEEVYTSETPTSSGIVHVDHSYHCIRIPSPAPTASSPSSSHYNRSSSLLHTPSDSEDEIDVVSVGSPDSAYSSSSSRSTSKRYGDTTFIATTTSGGMKKIVKVRTGTLPAKPSRRMRKQLQQAMAAGVKRRTSSAPGHGSVVLLRKAGVSTSSLKTPKRLQRSLGSRKRRSPRSDSDDPEKRQMHNSLERMRRVDLRNAFEDLRVLVPELNDREKAPKVEILKKASEHCRSISLKEQTLMQEKERQNRYHNDLRKRLLALQRQLR